jgi:hypothetical protein
MPTPTTKDAKQALYAVAGAADLAVKAYGQLVRRGETLVTGVRRSRPTRQANEATRNAASRTRAANTRARNSARSTRTSAKAASTTVRRAAAADASAAKAAASKVGDK